MKKILIQEGDQSIREILQFSLEADGFNVILIEECDKYLLSLIRKVNPDLVVLDFKLTGTQCILICQKIKSSFPGLPVIAISCNSNIGSIYKECGFDGFIEKPFDLYVLGDTLRRYASHSEYIY